MVVVKWIYNIVLLGYTVKEAVTIPLTFKGTATNLDYTPSTEALNFPAGNSAQTVKINIIDDVTIEDGAAETIIMSYTFKE
jgi:hypothetical protein